MTVWIDPEMGDQFTPFVISISNQGTLSVQCDLILITKESNRITNVSFNQNLAVNALQTVSKKMFLRPFNSNKSQEYAITCWNERSFLYSLKVNVTQTTETTMNSTQIDQIFTDCTNSSSSALDVIQNCK